MLEFARDTTKAQFIDWYVQLRSQLECLPFTRKDLEILTDDELHAFERIVTKLTAQRQHWCPCLQCQARRAALKTTGPKQGTGRDGAI